MLPGEIIPVTPAILVREAAAARYEGCRLITLSSVEIDAASIELLYHFETNLAMRHFRMMVPKGTAVPSISAVYPAAFLVENEIQDLFNIRFSGLAIDFRRTLYLEGESAEAPFCRHLATETPESEKDEPAPHPEPDSPSIRETAGSGSPAPPRQGSHEGPEGIL